MPPPSLYPNGRLRNLASVPLPEKERETTVVTGLPAGVTLAGEKLQLTPVTGEEQEKVTVWLNPYSGVTVRLMAADSP